MNFDDQRPNLRLKFKRTEQHFQDLLWVAQLRLFGWKRLWFTAISGPLVAGVLGYMLSETLLNGSQYSSATTVSIAVIGAIGFWLGVCIPKYIFKTRYLNDNGYFLAETSIDIFTDRIRTRTENSEQTMLWSAFVDVVIRNASIILLTDKADGLLIPADVFPSSQDKSSFIELVEKHTRDKIAN